jgi:hypothetical protein
MNSLLCLLDLNRATTDQSTNPRERGGRMEMRREERPQGYFKLSEKRERDEHDEHDCIVVLLENQKE